jgi:uncharacterized protein
MWLEPERLVREALQDFEQGKVISIPTKRYKTLILASRVVPKGLSRKMQGVGRRR